MNYSSRSVGVAEPCHWAVAGACSALEAFEKFFAAVHPSKFILEFRVDLGSLYRLFWGCCLSYLRVTFEQHFARHLTCIDTQKVHINYIKFQSCFRWFFHLKPDFLNENLCLAYSLFWVSFASFLFVHIRNRTAMKSARNMRSPSINKRLTFCL